MSLITTSVDPRLTLAVHVAEEYEHGSSTVGAAREASVGAIAVARANRSGDGAAMEAKERGL